MRLSSFRSSTEYKDYDVSFSAYIQLFKLYLLHNSVGPPDNLNFTQTQ